MLCTQRTTNLTLGESTLRRWTFFEYGIYTTSRLLIFGETLKGTGTSEQGGATKTGA